MTQRPGFSEFFFFQIVQYSASDWLNAVDLVEFQLYPEDILRKPVLNNTF